MIKKLKLNLFGSHWWYWFNTSKNNLFLVVMSGNKNISDCGVCFSLIETKHIDHTVQFECGHWFHSQCVRPWCERCLDNNNQPSCPLCRQTISNEYLDILGIDYFTTHDDFMSMINTIQLFTYIVKNKLYEDEKKLQQYIQRYPDEIDNIILMLEFYIH